MIPHIVFFFQIKSSRDRRYIKEKVLAIDYEQSLFLLRDSRAKRTSKRAKLPAAPLKHDAYYTNSSTRASRFNVVGDFRSRSFVRFPRLSLSRKRDCL